MRAQKILLEMTFKQKMERAIQSSGSCLMIGLDPDFTKLPKVMQKQVLSEPEAVRMFCQDIIDHTSAYCCGYKLNLAFFEAIGDTGLEVFHEVCKSIPKDKLIVADAKRGDIGNTASYYATAFYHRFECDAITLNPLMGMETLLPFLQDESHGLFVLALTSNSGASDIFLQQLSSGITVSEHIAGGLNELQQQELNRATIGMVAGATQTKHLKAVIERFPEAPLLIPGIGSQGGNPQEVIDLLCNYRMMAFPVISRSIIYAFDPNDNNWIVEVGQAAAYYRDLFLPLVKQR